MSPMFTRVNAIKQRASACTLALRAFFMLAARPASCAEADAGSAAATDLVLIHGTVLTVDVKDSTAQALAVRGGKIVAVGTNEEILRLPRPRGPPGGFEGGAAATGGLAR